MAKKRKPKPLSANAQTFREHFNAAVYAARRRRRKKMDAQTAQAEGIALVKTQGAQEWIKAGPLPGPLPAGLGMAGECFHDALLMSLYYHDLQYCEGLATIGTFEFPHGWCVNGKGLVIDTMPGVALEHHLGATISYRGFPINTACISGNRPGGGVASMLFHVLPIYDLTADLPLVLAEPRRTTTPSRPTRKAAVKSVRDRKASPRSRKRRDI